MAPQHAQKLKPAPDEPSASTSPGAALLDWYDRHRRDLPWRAKAGAQPDPYAVWLSEIMLQQTTVAAVKAYFTAFLARWPTVAELAGAPVEDVMQQWAGLGYYSRARNLHACAQAVMHDHAGRFPQREAELLQLPGIGPYTAAAIAAIAFDQRLAAVDGNVERVVTRLAALETPLPKAKPLIKEMTQALIPAERPGDFAQALMDLGATLCTPRRPACGLCPLRLFCQAAHAEPERFPLKAPKPERPERQGAVYVIRRGDAVLLRTRPPRGLLGGMAEFPGSEWIENFDHAKALQAAPIRGDYRRLAESVRHVFTHFALTLAVFVADVAAETDAPPGCRWVPAGRLGQEALPSLMRKVWTAASESAWSTIG